jgi:CHAD domain-containing protein/CYTH domain-containing protein
VRLPPDISKRTPEEATRLVALAWLDEACAALARMDDEEDAEALHDFRVAIRRLRSTSGTWRSALGKAASKKRRRALRRLQRSTGAGRDAEVALAWLETQRAELNQTQRVGLDWVAQHLGRRKEKAYESARADVRRAFGKLEPRLRRRLERLTVEIDVVRPKAPETYAESLAMRMRAHVQSLADELSAIRSAEDQAAIHDARIAGKELRYLVEPIQKPVKEARVVVKQLKGLQDLLGDMHDCVVLQKVLGQSLADAAAERARRLQELAAADHEGAVRVEVRRTERAGLLELSRRVQARLERLHQRLETEWLEGGIGQLVVDVERAAHELEARVRPPVEIERKFLLSDLPSQVREVEPVEIEQGWLPGDELRERLRRIRRADQKRFVRTIKLGRGIERVEVEEEATEEVFDALWPLTEGCRVQKRRYEVPEGERVWEIDEFTDRELVLAEIELRTKDEAVELPDWLRDHVVREVTDDDDYVNLNLAR